MAGNASHRKKTTIYQVQVMGRLREDWSEWFDGMTVTVTTDAPDGPVTILTGPVADQTALHGLLARIRDLALPLIAIRRVSSTQGE